MTGIKKPQARRRAVPAELPDFLGFSGLTRSVPGRRLRDDLGAGEM